MCEIKNEAIKCPKCNRDPISRFYSAQSPFEKVVEISCPFHRNRVVCVTGWCVSIESEDNLIRKAIGIWNNQDPQEPLMVFKDLDDMPEVTKEMIENSEKEEAK